MKNKKYDFRTAYIDLLINVLTGMVFLFMITTLLINAPKKEESGVKREAEYVIIMKWPSEINCDVDIWVRAPDKSIVFFANKDVKIMHIERDDLGWLNDVENGANEETWALRGKLAGEYTVNAHLYACRDKDKTYELGEKLPFILPVSFSLIQINPNVTVVLNQIITLEKVWEEKTAFNFTLLPDNSFDPKVNYDQHNLIKLKRK